MARRRRLQMGPVPVPRPPRRQQRHWHPRLLVLMGPSARAQQYGDCIRAVLRPREISSQCGRLGESSSRHEDQRVNYVGNGNDLFFGNGFGLRVCNHLHVDVFSGLSACIYYYYANTASSYFLLIFSFLLLLSKKFIIILSIAYFNCKFIIFIVVVTVLVLHDFLVLLFLIFIFVPQDYFDSLILFSFFLTVEQGRSIRRSNPRVRLSDWLGVRRRRRRTYLKMQSLQG